MESKANVQTRATMKYQKKVGIIAKSFKIKKELADNFKIACEKAGVSQASQISRMMQQSLLIRCRIPTPKSNNNRHKIIA